MKVLITCGPTWVPIDDVRVISNISSGQMGHLIARFYNEIGAKVTLLEGPVTHSLDVKGIRVIKYSFFDELAKALRTECAKKYDVIVHAAAVADFKLPKASKVKLSSVSKLNLQLVPTEKLIDSIKRLSPHSFLVGFKLESQLKERDLFRSTRKLFVESGCDVVVANTVSKGYAGFVIDADGVILAKAVSKRQLAKKLVQLLN